jgi:hypothetical protein
MPFEKGKSGNPRGRAKEKPFLDALRIAITDAGEDHKILRAVAAKLLKRAEAGDLAAIAFLAERLDGKADQAIVNGDDGPFEVAVTRIERVIVEGGAALAGFSEADLLLVREVLALAGDRPPSEVFGVIRGALLDHYGVVGA